MQLFGKTGDQVGQLFQLQLGGQLQVAALAGQVEQYHGMFAEQLVHLGGEGAKALEGATQQEHRRSRVALAGRIGLVVQAPARDLDDVGRAGQQGGAVVGAITQHGGTPVALVVLLGRHSAPPRLGWQSSIAR